MQKTSYRCHGFPVEIVQHAIWLYFRFPLGFRDVEDLLADRGVDVSYETVRRWALKFGPIYAGRLRRKRPRPDDPKLDQVFAWEISHMANLFLDRGICFCACHDQASGLSYSPEIGQ
ncbi:MAG: hypothetical protein K8F25_19240 [Fimbriimonadaceae bacterium]|nr:hypothetical protein [Alphaproteobacteria bacterium]